MDAHRRLAGADESAPVLGHADAGSLDLPLSRLTPQLGGQLDQLRYTRRAYGMAPALQAPAGIYWQPAPEPGGSRFREEAPFSLTAETEFLRLKEFTEG